MKKNFLMKALVCLFTVVAISSCSKDENDDDENGGNIGNTITATVENGSSYNEKINAAKVEFEYQRDDGKWDYYVAATAPYSNSSFTLQLPENVSDTYLKTFDDDDDDNEFPEGVTVSNRNVKRGQALIGAYKGDHRVGYFYFATGITDMDWSSNLIYANGDVNITGSHTETYNRDSNGVTHVETYIDRYNVYIKKGWNMVYETWKESGNTYEHETTTTAFSSGKWWCYYYSTSED
jgi:hypothetical protein